MAKFVLKFLNADSNNSISYLPFGVTTIEMSAEGDIIDGFIRTKNRRESREDGDKRCVGFADSTEDILVVWGAGKEKGQKVEAGTKGRVFLQLLHLRNIHESESLTLTHSEENSWEQQIYISSAWNQNEVARMALGGVPNDMRHISFEGAKIPLYYPRWFPPRPSEGKRIEYKEVAYPKLSVEFLENDRSVYSPISIYLHDNGNKRKICNIEGDLSYAWPHLELFALLPDQGIFVIRLWLYWIHKRFTGDWFYGFEASNTSEKGEYRQVTQKLVLEIPDIERFDFVLDAKLGRITWFGTDFHYQEHWGRVKGDVAEARIAGGFDLVQETLGRIFDRFKKPEHYDLVEKLEEILSDQQKIESMKFMSVPEMSYSDVVERAYKNRAIFNIKTHVPYVRNGEISSDMVSSVVSEVVR